MFNDAAIVFDWIKEKKKKKGICGSNLFSLVQMKYDQWFDKYLTLIC